MATNILKALLALLEISATLIATSIIVLGVARTSAFFEGAYNTISGAHAPLTGDYSATADNELRFYATLWFAYGVLAVRAGLDLSRQKHRVPWLAVVFFAGGLARLVSILSVGAPHPVFVSLMAIELGLPVILIRLWRRA